MKQALGALCGLMVLVLIGTFLIALGAFWLKQILMPLVGWIMR